MLNRKYRMVVAGILAGAALFSPLLCGMTCPEARVQKSSVSAEVAPTAGEFMGEFMERGLVGCVLTHVILRIDAKEWAQFVRLASWVWVGVKVVRFVEGR